MKRIGFLSFGHWQAAPGSQSRTAAEALIQSIELAEAAEDIGIDGAYFRVHHFARQLAAPFPLLAAVGARTKRIEIGTGVIDMRYENPLYMAEEAAAADLISGGRLQLGVSRGSPEPADRGSERFGYVPREGQTDGDVAREHIDVFLAAIKGQPMAQAAGSSATLSIQPHSPGLADRIWWGSGSSSTAPWTAQQGMNLMSSTLLLEDTGVPFDQLQAEQIAMFRNAWSEAGHERTPRVSVSRSVLPVTSDLDRRYFGDGRGQSDQIGLLEGVMSRFGKQYVGSPEVIAEELSRDAAVRAADTVMLTVPNQLGVDYNARMLQTIADHIAPAIGWTPANAAASV